MIVSPKEAIELGILTFPESWSREYIEKLIQPNAIDFPMNGIRRITIEADVAVISESERKFASDVEADTDNDYYKISRTGLYDISSDIRVNLPNGYAGYVITRSSLRRVGLQVASGLYDSGFEGKIGAMLSSVVSDGEDVLLGKDVRVGQFIIIRSDDSSKMYDGIYNGLEDVLDYKKD